MSLRHHALTEGPAETARASSTPQMQQQQSSGLLPSTTFASAGTARVSPLPHPLRRPQFDRGNARLPSSPHPSSYSHLPITATAATTMAHTPPGATSLAHLAPHSPAVARASFGASPRQTSASMRGTPAAQRMHSTSYAARNTSPGVGSSSSNNTAAARSSLSSASRSLADRPLSTSTSRPASSASAPVYYVVGGAVVNPQLTVSPSVQGEVRGVSTLAVLPDAMRRPEIGPMLNNTHQTTATTNTTANTTATSTPPSSSGMAAATSEVDGDAAAKVVRVEGVHTSRPTPDHLPYLQQAQESQTSSLTLLRQLYGTTAEDVIEVAHPNPRNGQLEPPRIQYHTAQELLPELTSSEAQIKAAANARRRIDWEARIPTAATLPPPAITFTTAAGAPAALLSAVLFTVDTSTLAMQRDFAAEKAMNAAGGGRASTSGEPAATAASTAMPLLTAAAAARGAGNKASLFQEEEKVGLEISREDRIGSSGLYRIHHLVGLRQGLGEMVGLDRVLEYEVSTSSTQLFIVQPYINASAGDLLMELNTSLQGTAKLTITGVDCGSVDAHTGRVQRSTNSLVCYITLKHSANAAMHERSLTSLSSDGLSHFARVPSAATARSPMAGGNGSIGAFPASSVTTNYYNTSSSNRENGGLDGQARGGFALSLAHFSQEYAAADRPGSRNLSLTRDAANAGNNRAGAGAADAHHHNSLDVQGVVARSGSGAAVSGAYTGANRTAASGGGRRPRSGALRRQDSSAGGRSSNKDKADPYFLFALTNPHDLRYRHCAESVRLCRVRQFTRQQAKTHGERAATQRRCDAQPTAADKAAAILSIANANAHGGTSTSHPRHPVVRHNGHAAAVHHNWSDNEAEEELQELSCEASEESQSHRPSSAATNASASASAGNKRARRKSVVEILELEEEYDHNNPVAIPAMSGAHSHSSTQSAASAGGRHGSSGAHTHNESHNAADTHCRGGDGGHLEAEAPPDLYAPRLPASLFCLNTMQSPVSYLRITVWQDRLLLLFTEEDKELLRSDHRARFKREARLELTEGLLAGMLSSTFSWGGGASSSSIGGRKLSMQGRRSSAVFNPRNFSSGGGGIAQNSSTSRASGTNQPTSGGSSPSSSGRGVASPEKPFAMMRRLVLCLTLEEERSSVQLYADVVQLCAHLSHSALLKTISLTRGTRDGLQQAAAAVLSASSPAPSPKGKRGGVPTTWEATSTFSASDRQALRQLSDSLELAMTVTVLIGAFGAAVEYAVQRVHALCLLEGDTTAVVNAAQRDLVETYLFYGDYSTAVTIAEDMVMLTEQLCADAPDAYEVAEAEALCTLACVAANRRDRLDRYITRLEMNVLPMAEDPNKATTLPQPLLQAELRLVLAYAKTYRQHARHVSATAEVVRLTREAVQLLRGDGDLQEMEQSFSTVFPCQARLLANLDASSTNIPLALRGRRASAASCNITTGPQLTNRSFADLNGPETTAKMMAAQKRLRWNLLSFAGALLVESQEVGEGVAVMESTVRELVLGQHRYVERTHRSSLAAMLWVGLVLTKIFMQPEPKEDFALMLKEVASRVVRTRGPLHPFAAVANLQYANIAHHSQNSRHGLSLVARSLSVLESAVSPQSHYVLIAHYVFGSMAESQQRWRLALEHLGAAYAAAQAGHFCEHVLLLLEGRFVGALLSCPPTTVVELNTAALRDGVDGRLNALRSRLGPHSEELVEPLWNVAEVRYLLKQPASAVECLQQALQLLDRRGVLQSSADVLRPVDALRLEQHQRMAESGGEMANVDLLIQRRNSVVQTSFENPRTALRLANTLYMLGAVCEAQALSAEALLKYEQCMAIFEALELADDALPVARIMMAMAKVLYTTAQCGDALVWANKAERLLHTHYRKQWPAELESATKLVAIVERRLCDDEGTYVVQSDAATSDELPQLL